METSPELRCCEDLAMEISYPHCLEDFQLETSRGLDCRVDLLIVIFHQVLDYRHEGSMRCVDHLA